MEKFSNNAQSTLNGAINSSVTSLVVTSAASFPTTGNFRIVIDSELLLVTAVSGTTFTVIRGVEGTTAASHANSAIIAHEITAGGLAQTIADQNIVNGAMVTGPAAIANNTTTAVSFSTTVHDDATYFNGTTKLTAPVTGFYLINCYIHWPSNNTGNRIVELRKNGSTLLNGSGFAAGSIVNDVRHEISALLYLTAADYIEVAAFQNSGGSMTPSYGSFSISRLT